MRTSWHFATVIRPFGSGSGKVRFPVNVDLAEPRAFCDMPHCRLAEVLLDRLMASKAPVIYRFPRREEPEEIRL